MGISYAFSIVPRRESEPGFGRIYNPPLRTRLRFPCRGGLYIRPDCTPFAAGFAERTGPYESATAA